MKSELPALAKDNTPSPGVRKENASRGSKTRKSGGGKKKETKLEKKDSVGLIMNMDLDNEIQAKIIPFYEPKQLRERNIYLDSDSDLEKSNEPYENLSFEKRARIKKEGDFQKVIEKYRKVKESEEKIRIRKEAALQLRK